MKVAAVATVGAAIGIGTSSAKEYLEFDKQMIKVKALTGATIQEYEALKKKAMEVGKQQYSHLKKLQLVWRSSP